ncbi:electron transfer flavoprotein subunit beta/FixA family protein [Paraburkholderia kirstenboschensis]|uniref:Electron transfer flavoprotein subunit beta n=1 Tax=Paraburkholderia kirstenboschensis TaxID=1245436 RepID=A0ABZ0EIC3_9BURK|nr:electron transfer flavoprotein subunit beta/FixA family protein [Paraburkholderia kirstenboschensis]WOD16969.1 electron transfer flavoprotein subunit beta/FixA family protein [Paraburkholderia kirstenboschensis]
MKVLVAVKRVVDFNVNIRVKSDQTGVDTNNVKMSINPFDEVAVEQAVRLKEAGIASEIIVVSVGPEKASETLRTGLAVGADRAILVHTDVVTEPLAVAKVLRAVIDQEKPSLVLLGKQAIDDDCNQTGQMLAGLLGWAQGTSLSGLVTEGQKLKVTREIDTGTQELALSLPAIATVDLRLNDPRHPSLPNIMKAKKKPLDTVTPESLGVDVAPRMTVLKVLPPEQRQAGKMVATVAELAAEMKLALETH